MQWVIFLLAALVIATVWLFLFFFIGWLKSVLKKLKAKVLLQGRTPAEVLTSSRYAYGQIFTEDEGRYWIYEKEKEGLGGLVLRVDTELDALIWILEHSKQSGDPT